MPMTPQALHRALMLRPHVDHPALPGRKNHLSCGVLIPIRWMPEPEVVLTLRPPQLQHGGEVCFPGGRPDEGDEDMGETALREAREELGIEDPTVLGRLSSMPLYTSDYRLEPFVADIGDQALDPAPAEVAEVIVLDLRTTLRLPHIDALPFQWKGETQHSPVFDAGAHLLYGATAHSFLELLQVVAPLMGERVPPMVSGRHEWSRFLKT
jgi:8-oxo-dGTP pyrophosphatase MutT (NUDIX family)